MDWVFKGHSKPGAETTCARILRLFRRGLTIPRMSQLGMWPMIRFVKGGGVQNKLKMMRRKADEGGRGCCCIDDGNKVLRWASDA